MNRLRSLLDSWISRLADRIGDPDDVDPLISRLDRLDGVGRRRVA